MPTLDGIVESALYVADLDRSVRFYRSVFGLEVVESSDRLCALLVVRRQLRRVY